MVREINSERSSRKTLEKRHGTVYSTTEMMKEFEMVSFAAPFVVVKRKEDGQLGTLMFQHTPRFYFEWQADEQKGK